MDHHELLSVLCLLPFTSRLRESISFPEPFDPLPPLPRPILPLTFLTLEESLVPLPMGLSERMGTTTRWNPSNTGLLHDVSCLTTSKECFVVFFMIKGQVIVNVRHDLLVCKEVSVFIHIRIIVFAQVFIEKSVFIAFSLVNKSRRCFRSSS